MEIKNKNQIDREFNELWREYEPYIRKLCNFKLSSHIEYVDDCVQDVFTALLEEMYRGTTIKKPKSWLTTVTNNMIKDIYEHSKRD